jgi:MtfA peptidase
MIDRVIKPLLSVENVPPLADALWHDATARFDFVTRLPADSQAQLRVLAAQFIAQHEWTGAGGFALTDTVMVAIAAQACLPVLHLSLDLYDRFVGIVVYPSGFLIPKTEMDEDGVVHEWTEEASGEAWPGGPVILSWEDACAASLDTGYNVVIHEFAHKLDMADGVDDGIPVMDARFHRHINRTAFERTLADAYERFCEAADTLEEDFDSHALWNIDLYGTQHPAEFFAVSVETLLTCGAPDADHPLAAWFALLASYLKWPLEALEALAEPKNAF